MKTKIIDHMIKIVNKKSTSCHLDIQPIAWNVFWQDVLDICCRMKKDLSIASEQPIVGYMGKLTELLHASRRYLVRTEDEADSMVMEAMKQLEDTRHVYCVDGLLMLYNCLPTDYKGNG